ncbi:uncharacterized protein B0H64DRAFT_377142 [Chaetomium fimeti]|uniref:Secreted protein n=1 Tax=Chaetomium fimeti TaxID=1854472 RepID=A0AAE0LPI6_9PEZI|nr:hypothetical protein B0H64DRAFT_377142 [Chaetomium fimeti]
MGLELELLLFLWLRESCPTGTKKMIRASTQQRAVTQRHLVKWTTHVVAIPGCTHGWTMLVSAIDETRGGRTESPGCHDTQQRAEQLVVSVTSMRVPMPKN